MWGKNKMKVLSAHITWNSLPTYPFIWSKAEAHVEGVGSISIEDFISEETRSKLYDEIVVAVHKRIEMASTDSKEF